MWNQISNPLTMRCNVRRLPLHFVMVLLVLIPAQVQAHIAGQCRAVRAQPSSPSRSSTAHGSSIRARCSVFVSILPDLRDRPERHLPLSVTVSRPFRTAERAVARHR